MLFYNVRVEHVKDGVGTLVGKGVPQGKSSLTITFWYKTRVDRELSEISTKDRLVVPLIPYPQRID